MALRVLFAGAYRAASDVDALPAARIYKRDKDGKFATSAANPDFIQRGPGGALGEDTYDESEFGDGGYVASSYEGTIQIGVRHKDGKVESFADIDQPDEAQQLLDAVEWAQSHDVSGHGDRGPDPATGLLDWKASPATGHVVGPRPNGDIAIAHDDGAEGLVFSSREIGDFASALDQQISSAREALSEAEQA